MHIGIDARCIFSPRPRGTGRNLADALRLMPSLRPDWRLTLYHRRPASDCPLAREAAPWKEPRAANVRTRRFELPGDRFDAWFQLGLPTVAWFDGIDLLHFPASAAPAWCPVPYVVTVHDLIPFVLPDECSARERRRFENGVRRAVRSAVHLIVPSRATRDDLRTTLDVSKDRVSIVPWAPDTAVLAHAAEMQRRSGGEAQGAKLADLCERYGLKRPWLLNFSGDSPRKNAHRLIEAFARLPAEFRKEHLLLLVGCAAPQTRAELHDLATRLGVADRCRIVDFVPHEDLPALLAGAAALLIPSQYEGFGLPVLDAFASGVPVLTSHVSSLPEIAGDAAIYCDPQSPESIADSIVQVLQLETARVLVRRGYERVQGYTWEQTARAMCAVYEHALGAVGQAVPRESGAAVPLTALAFWIVYVGGVCAAVVAPAVGVAVYVLVYHLNPEAQWWGGTFDASGIRPSLTIAVATVLGIFLRRPRLPEGGRQFPATVILMLTLTAYALLTLSWADLSWVPSLNMAQKACKLAIFLLILVRCIHTPRQYLLVFLSWLVGVVYLGYEAWGHIGIHVRGRLAVGLGGPDFAESSDLAVHLVASLPLVGALFFSSRTWWGRLLALLTGALAVNTIVMTRTRNVLVGVAAMSFMACFWLPRGYRLKGCAAIVIGLALAIQLTDPGWWKRMGTITQYERDASIENRLVFWNAAANMAANRPLGVGLGQFRLRVQEYTPQNPFEHSAHSTYMSCLAELGIPGALLLGALLAAAFGQLSRIRRGAQQFESDIPVAIGPWHTRFHLGWHAMALQTALVGYLGCAVFCTRLWAEDFWILLGLVACLGNVGAQLRASSARPEGAEEPALPDAPALDTAPLPASFTTGGL